MKRSLITLLAITAIALSGCSTWQRLDESGYFDDVLTAVATAGTTWVMSTYLTPQAESIGSRDAVKFLVEQRWERHYDASLLLTEYRKTPYNPVLEEVLLRYRDDAEARGYKPAEKHINSLIRGIQEAERRS